LKRVVRSNDADVVIVGGGPVGLVQGLLLARRGVRVVILEKGDYPRDKPCGEGLMPGGVQVLGEVGIDLGQEGFPAVPGVRYRLPGGGGVVGVFRARPGLPGTGYGVRRTKFDTLLAERAGAQPNLALNRRCRVTGLRPSRTGIEIETDSGSFSAPLLIGADGLRSPVRGLMGWSVPPRRPFRYGLVGHLTASGHGVAEVVVTVLGSSEVYVAPTGRDEVLAAVLAGQGLLRQDGLGVRESYLRAVLTAHPELAGAECGPVTGAGPFRVKSRTVADRGVFLLGDAAGFLDPITGDGMSAGFLAAAELARLLVETDPASAAAAYRAWYARQWRTRSVITAIALKLTGSPALAGRALRGIGGHPGALASLLEVNSGARSLSSIPLREWATLVGV
jgi:2-polyprenyl-6-methoxyphenol hydroxylase-like FAD-dependent oxidoreductase